LQPSGVSGAHGELPVGQWQSKISLRYHPVVPILTRDDVQHLARLARLELADEEVDLFVRQLADILEFARQVDAVDTLAAPVAPATHPSGPLREDVVVGSLDRDAVLASAPGADRAAGLFKVPRVLNG